SLAHRNRRGLPVVHDRLGRRDPPVLRRRRLQHPARRLERVRAAVDRTARPRLLAHPHRLPLAAHHRHRHGRELLDLLRLAHLTRPPGTETTIPAAPVLGAAGIVVCERGCADQAPAGNQMAISRSADSTESEPWTMFFWTPAPQSRARAPRMVPGAASVGSETPAMTRKPRITSSPEATRATIGPEDLKSTRAR